MGETTRKVIKLKDKQPITLKCDNSHVDFLVFFSDGKLHVGLAGYTGKSILVEPRNYNEVKLLCN